MTTFRTLRYETEALAEGSLATVTLNRPERRNAIGSEMANELLHALAAAHDDPAVRVIVLQGAGGHFCAGGDFAQMTGGAEGDPLPMRGDFADLLLALMNATKPVIAKVRGAALGGGLGLVASTHFALAAADAQLATPEIHRGLFPMMIMAVLARTVPRRKLLEMMLLGAKMSAADAERAGIVNRVVEPDGLDDAVRTLATELAGRSPTAMARGLAAWSKQRDTALEEALPVLREALGDLLGTDDAREGLMAFMEKRKPVWTGR